MSGWILSVDAYRFLTFNSKPLSSFPSKYSNDKFDINKNHCFDSMSRKSEFDSKWLRVATGQIIHNHLFNKRSAWNESLLVSGKHKICINLFLHPPHPPRLSYTPLPPTWFNMKPDRDKARSLFCYSIWLKLPVCVTRSPLQKHGPTNRKETQTAKFIGSTSIRYRSDTFASGRYLIDVDPKVFAIWVPTRCRPAELFLFTGL